MSESKLPDFANDRLGRQAFADRLAKIITGMATAPILPAGRVVAVDGPWGVGKSWIAERLPAHFDATRGIGRCVYVNAFEYDFHQDPFSVVASAIWDATRGTTKARKKFGDAAKAVIKLSAPALARIAVAAGSKALGIDSDEIGDDIADALGKAGEKAVTSSLDTLSRHKQTREAFRARLRDLASEEGGPLVVVVDELDRCRPSFALELLERIKHFFDVEGVAFVLFIHASALHSAIEATYGPRIDARAYLRKFISITLPVPNTVAPGRHRDHRGEAEFVNTFLRASLPNYDQLSAATYEFYQALSELAPIFRASLRDVQSVAMLGSVIGQGGYNYGAAAAYTLLLKVCDPAQHDLLPTRESATLSVELARVSRLPKDQAQYVDDLRNELEILVTGKPPEHGLDSRPWQPVGLNEICRLIEAFNLSRVKLN